MKRIRLAFGGVKVEGELDDSPLAEQVWKLLPLACHGETWGGEIYFPVSLKAAAGQLVETVAVGDIAYWPDGPDLCVFFGPTPKSTGPAPVVAEAVTVIGRFAADPDALALMVRERDGIPVRVERLAGAVVESASVDTGQ
ncbi:MAG: cyclophilin-like fold protein [bacterium]